MKAILQVSIRNTLSTLPWSFKYVFFSIFVHILHIFCIKWHKLIFAEHFFGAKKTFSYDKPFQIYNLFFMNALYMYFYPSSLLFFS